MSKSEVASVRYTPEELVQLSAVADSFGVKVSSFIRQASMMVAEAIQAGGQASCHHMSIGRVKGASCGECGPLPVSYQLTLPGHG